MKEDKVYVQHILDAILTVEDHVNEVDFSEFERSRLIQDAVIREIEIIGEASNNISSDFKNSHQAIPWSEIISMRNKLIHEYFGVDNEAVWKVVKKDLPELKKQIQKIYPAL